MKWSKLGDGVLKNYKKILYRLSSAMDKEKCFFLHQTGLVLDRMCRYIWRGKLVICFSDIEAFVPNNERFLISLSQQKLSELEPF